VQGPGKQAGEELARGDEVPDQVGADQQGEGQAEQLQDRGLPRGGGQPAGTDLDADAACEPFDQIDLGRFRTGPAAPGAGAGRSYQ